MKWSNGDYDFILTGIVIFLFMVLALIFVRLYPICLIH